MRGNLTGVAMLLIGMGIALQSQRPIVVTVAPPSPPAPLPVPALAPVAIPPGPAPAPQTASQAPSASFRLASATAVGPGLDLSAPPVPPLEDRRIPDQQRDQRERAGVRVQHPRLQRADHEADEAGDADAAKKARFLERQEEFKAVRARRAEHLARMHERAENERRQVALWLEGWQSVWQRYWSDRTPIALAIQRDYRGRVLGYSARMESGLFLQESLGVMPTPPQTMFMLQYGR